MTLQGQCQDRPASDTEHSDVMSPGYQMETDTEHSDVRSPVYQMETDTEHSDVRSPGEQMETDTEHSDATKSVSAWSVTHTATSGVR